MKDTDERYGGTGAGVSGYSPMKTIPERWEAPDYSTPEQQARIAERRRQLQLESEARRKSGQAGGSN